MDANEAVSRRMHGLGLWGGASAGTPAEAVSRLAAMQGQEFAYALWGTAQRVRRAGGIRSVDARAMRAAFNAGELLRTHAVRPTWHLLARDDTDWMLRLLSERVHAANAYMYRTTGVDDEVAHAGERAIAAAVAGGPRTRAELTTALAAAGVTGDGVRIGYVLMRAELDRVIVSGPLRGRQHTYADYDARVPVRDATDREHDLAELARRYFRTRGPASVKDFARWSGLTLADARHGHAEVASELVSDAVEHPELERVEVWFEAADAPGAPARPRLDLVQGYDECVMSYSETQVLLFEGTDPRRSATPTLAAYLHTVLLDGRLAGHWKATPTRSEVRIDVQLDDPLDDAEAAALEAAGTDYADYLGLSLG
ncbi:winged helix DNA-binding domain-containing protein [Leifsonia sp. NPDC058248]|uniref:winged helix DNA-binding domain-containing protein n=1 Tax=Leifsonia sp. NPDC058248 TaxID=3346402 RepID=UPI0036D9D7FF